MKKLSMKTAARTAMLAATLVLAASLANAQGAKPLTKCAPDAVVSGTVCMDKYEASVWFVPDATTDNKGLVKKIRQGKVKLADLTDGGASQVGVVSDGWGLCGDTGTLCTGFFAVSVAGVTPSAYGTWFQAVEACGNSGKRLPSNVEWQKAVTNTPDNGDNGTTNCNVASAAAVVSTGSRSVCMSSAGAFDMVGNLAEWVADWVPASEGPCPGWGVFSNDAMCLTGASTVATSPGALVRGGSYSDGTGAGSLSVDGGYPASGAFNPSVLGFRCAR